MIFRKVEGCRQLDAVGTLVGYQPFFDAANLWSRIIELRDVRDGGCRGLCRWDRQRAHSQIRRLGGRLKRSQHAKQIGVFII